MSHIYLVEMLIYFFFYPLPRHNFTILCYLMLALIPFVLHQIVGLHTELETPELVGVWLISCLNSYSLPIIQFL